VSRRFWFSWTPNTDGTAAVEVCGDGFKAVGAVYTRGEDGLTPVASEAEDSRCPVRGTGTSFQTEAGTEYLQFSPAEELQVVSAVMMKNMQAMQHA